MILERKRTVFAALIIVAVVLLLLEFQYRTFLPIGGYDAKEPPQVAHVESTDVPPTQDTSESHIRNTNEPKAQGANGTQSQSAKAEQFLLVDWSIWLGFNNIRKVEYSKMS